MPESRERVFAVEVKRLAQADPFGLFSAGKPRFDPEVYYVDLLGQWADALLSERLKDLPCSGSVGAGDYSVTYGREPDYFYKSHEPGLFLLERSSGFALDAQIVERLGLLNRVLDGLAQGKVHAHLGQPPPTAALALSVESNKGPLHVSAGGTDAYFPGSRRR